MAEPAAILYSLPRKTEYSYSRAKYEKVAHQGVWALQTTLRQINPTLGEGFADGYFGARTEEAVKNYQARRGLLADGIAGPGTQKRMVQGWRTQAQNETGAKAGLLDGFCELEGGWMLAPVNWSVAKGVDVGAVQNRVYDMSGTTSWTLISGVPTQTLLDRVVFDPNKVAAALNAKNTIRTLGNDLISRFSSYYNDPNRVYPYTRGNQRRSWEMASLYHNWPYASDRLARGGTLPNTTASWIPQALRDRGIDTYTDWANYYVSVVTKYVTW